MTLTAQEVAICNQALAKIGQFQIDFSLTTSTSDKGLLGNVASKCEVHYDQTLKSLLRMANWNFASDRLSLVDSWATATAYTTDQYVWVSSVLYKCNEAHTSTTWNTDYVYDGSDLVYDDDEQVRDDTIDFKWDMILYRSPFEYSYKYALPADFIRLKPKYLEDYDIDAKVENGYILTDETELDIKYIKYVTDTDEWDDLFTEVFIYDLALKVLYSLAGTNVRDLKIDLQRERQMAFSRAKSVYSEETYIRDKTYDWNNSRYRQSF